MTTRKSMKRQLQFELLERRETPSALVGGAHVIHEAGQAIHEARAKPKPKPKLHTYNVSIQDAGQASLGTLTPDPATGFFTATGSVSGTINVSKPKTSPIRKSFGAYSGNLTAVIASTAQQSFADGQFHMSQGELDLHFTVTSGSIASGMFAGTYAVSGGNGAFAHTTGGGSWSASLDSTSGALSISFPGNLTVKK